jgi:molybdate transport system ATP-binding protein
MLRFEALRLEQGGFTLKADFTVSEGITVLSGPSGAGKTSLLHLAAGLRRPRSGRILLGDEVLTDGPDGRFVPPHRRRFGVVFQEPRLFPHLTVHQNLRYGRWFRRPPLPADEFDRVVTLLDIGPLLPRRPGRLSGGEAQRVALGRALLSAPRLLLMDEPLAALDEARKAEILPYLETLRDIWRLPILYVSHASAEVERLASRVLRVADGRVSPLP